MTIFLIRHGETVDNAGRIFQTPSSPLSENGNDQAEKLSLRLAKANITDIICSDYLRTRETASYTAEKVGVEPIYTDRLRERNFGRLRGSPYAELDFDPFAQDYQPDHGEDWPTFHQRIADAWGLIVKTSAIAKGDVLVVTHGFVCQAIVSNHALTEDHRRVPERWGNTSVTEIDSESPWRVTKLNCSDHLHESLDNPSSDRRETLGRA